MFMIKKITSILMAIAIIPLTVVPAFSQDDNISLDSVVSSYGDDCVVEFFGDVQSYSHQAFIAEMDEKSAACDKMLVVIESNGGVAFAGDAMAASIKEHKADTLVFTYAISAGANMWLAGDTRYMTTDAQIGFHLGFIPSKTLTTWMDEAILGILLDNADRLKEWSPKQVLDFIDQLRYDYLQQIHVEFALDDIKYYEGENIKNFDAFMERLIDDGIGANFAWYVTPEEAVDIIGNTIIIN